MQRELNRLRDQKEILKMRSSAIGDNQIKSQAGAGGASGYQLMHVLIVAIISLIIGALLK